MEQEQIRSALMEMGFDEAMIGKDLDVHIQWMINQQEQAEPQNPAKVPEAKSIHCDECGKLFRTVDDANLHAERTGHEKFSESSEEIKPLSAEERAEQLKLLQEKLKQKREERAAQEVSEQAKAIKMHRESQRKLTELAKLNEEKELQKLVEQRKKQKEDDLRAKQRVLAQIEADRQERRLRNAPMPSQPVAKVTEEVKRKEPTGTVSQLRIKFRDGKILTETFQASDKLEKVFKFIDSAGGHSKYKLLVPFPKEELKDKGKTLLELGLVPSAMLMVE